MARSPDSPAGQEGPAGPAGRENPAGPAGQEHPAGPAGREHPAGRQRPPLLAPERTIGGRRFDFSRQVAVMAIVNRTPDSFYDQGRTFALDAAVAAVEEAVAAGADWVDIGGQPFAPGPEITVSDELSRIVPLVEEARARTGTVLSVETYRPETARQAIAAGASVINDTTGLRDPEVADVVADSGATLVLTHSLAPPRTPLPRPRYDDVVTEVAQFLRERAAHATARGVPPERLVVDPGHDLNKNTYHSLALTRRLDEITALGYPTLVAVSNKDFIGETLDAPREARRDGTLAALVACILGGARIVRVHEVAPAVDAARMTEAVLGLRPPAVARHNM